MKKIVSYIVLYKGESICGWPRKTNYNFETYKAAVVFKNHLNKTFKGAAQVFRIVLTTELVSR